MKFEVKLNLIYHVLEIGADIMMNCEVLCIINYFYLLSRDDFKIYKDTNCFLSVNSAWICIYTKLYGIIFLSVNSLYIICKLIQGFNQFIQLYIHACFPTSENHPMRFWARIGPRYILLVI